MKKILLSILGVLIGFVGFGYCDDIYGENLRFNSYISVSQNTTYVKFLQDNCINGFYMYLYGTISNSEINSIFSSNSGLISSVDFVQNTCSVNDSWASSNCKIYYLPLISPVCLSSGEVYPFLFNGFYDINREYNVYYGLYTPVVLGDYFSLTGLNIGKYSENTNTIIGGINYTLPPSAPTFIVNYGSQLKEYTLDGRLDIYINSPVSKNGSLFTFDGSTGINLIYNGQYNRYTKNKLYLDGQFWYRQNIFTPICL